MSTHHRVPVDRRVAVPELLAAIGLSILMVVAFTIWGETSPATKGDRNASVLEYIVSIVILGALCTLATYPALRHYRILSAVTYPVVLIIVVVTYGSPLLGITIAIWTTPLIASITRYRKKVFVVLRVVFWFLLQGISSEGRSRRER